MSHAADQEGSKFPLQSEYLLNPIGKDTLEPDTQRCDVTGQPSAATFALLKRLGPWSTFVLVSSLPALLAAIAFLLFLWESSSANNVWILIVRNGWVPRSITLTAIVIRVVVAAQSVVCVSLLSATLLECGTITLLDAPTVSILRFVNSGPSSLAQILGGTSRQSKALGVLILTLVLFLTTSVSQFTSTLLLTDIQSTPILLEPETANIPVTLDQGRMENIDLCENLDTWTQIPGSFPTFAEYSEPGLRTEELDDTGHLFRAFLPFQREETRSLLATYHGNSTIYDARTVCVRPMVQMKIQKMSTTPYGELDPYLHLNGTIRLTQSQYNGSTTVSSFGCLAPLPSGPQEDLRGSEEDELTEASEWRVAICQTDSGSFMDNSEFDNIHMIIVNVTGTYEQWNRTVNYADTWGDIVYANDEWFTYFDSPSQTGINFTVCFQMDFSTYSQPILAKDGINHTEPTLGYDISNRRYKTDELMKSLKVGGPEVQQSSPQTRGQLALERPTLETFDSFDFLAIDLAYETSYFLCSYCHYSRSDFLNNEIGLPSNMTATRVRPPLAAIFNSALQTTGRPAQALQALYTVLRMMRYTAFMPLYDVLDTATYQVYSSSLAPARKIGLTVVITMITTHLVVVAICVILFAHRSQKSLIGNSWTAVAQVNEIGEAREWLGRAGVLTDKDIKQQMRFRGVSRKLVGLSPSFETHVAG